MVKLDQAVAPVVGCPLRKTKSNFDSFGFYCLYFFEKMFLTVCKQDVSIFQDWPNLGFVGVENSAWVSTPGLASESFQEV